MEGPSEHGHEPLGTTKDKEFLVNCGLLSCYAV
jgi:hypothetical protein